MKITIVFIIQIDSANRIFNSVIQIIRIIIELYDMPELIGVNSAAVIGYFQYDISVAEWSAYGNKPVGIAVYSVQYGVLDKRLQDQLNGSKLQYIRIHINCVFQTM